MKIAHVLWNLGTGGIQTMLVDIANIQCQSNDVAVMVVDAYIHESIVEKMDSKIAIYRCNRLNGEKSILPILKLNLFLWRFKPDIIHVHMPGMAKFLFVPYPKVYTYHSTRLPTKEHFRYKRNFAISESVQKEVASKGLDIVRVDNGIDCDSYCNRKKPFFADGAIHAVQVSRLVQKKGQDLVLEALNRLSKKTGTEALSKKLHVHFVGDGPLLDYLKNQVKVMALEKIVSFEGFKDAQWVKEHLCDFDLFLQPSRFEGFGLTVAEAMASKVPVIVSDNEGPMEIISNGRYGIFFKNESVESLAATLREFIEKGMKQNIIEDAYQYVRKVYDVKRTASQYLKQYSSVIKKER